MNTLIFSEVAEPRCLGEGLNIVMIEDCLMASSSDEKIQEAIHNFSKDTFYPMMGAKVTISEYVKFI